MSNPITIVLATGNTGKVKELQSYFTEMPLRLEPQERASAGVRGALDASTRCYVVC